jgi:DNA-binding CsgD family transcriptional regulator
MPEPMVRRVRERALELRPAEARVLAEVFQGKATPQIAGDLGLSQRTIGAHLDHIGVMLGCSRSELIRIFSYELSDDRQLFDGLMDW